MPIKAPERGYIHSSDKNKGWGKVALATGVGKGSTWLLGPHDARPFNFDHDGNFYTVTVTLLPLQDNVTHLVEILENGICPLKPHTKEWNTVWAAFLARQSRRNEAKYKRSIRKPRKKK